MFPDKIVELLVARFTFVSHVHPQYPLITMTRKKHSPSGSMTVVRDWFDRIVSAEKARLPANAVLRFAEYRILSGDVELFKVNGMRFEKVVLVLGDEFSYWSFYENVQLTQRVEGEATLPVSFCACCFHRHYQKVMKLIKNSFYKPRSEDLA